MLDLTQLEYVAAVWFLAGTGHDLLTYLYREPGKPDWMIWQRIRSYNPNPDGSSSHPWAGLDDKSAMSAQLPRTKSGRVVSETEAVSSVRSLVRAFGANKGFRLRREYFVRISGPPDTVFDKLKDQPWFHWKYVEKE